MTRKSNARIAGFTFLLYIAFGLTSVFIMGPAARGEGIGAKLANIARHVTDVRVAFLFSLVTAFCALVLGVTLYAITRDQDRELAMLGLICRVAEGVIGMGIPVTLGLVWLASAAGANALDTGAVNTLGLFLRKIGTWDMLISATFFAVGSMLFSYLLLRGRMIPVPLAWLGVVASVLLVVILPLQLAEFIRGPVTMIMWLPMLVFEVVLALWLIIKGVAMPARKQSA